MASEVAKRLRDRRLSVWNEARGLAESAAESNRAFSAEEQGTWEALNSELDELDKRIKSVLDTEQRSRDADAAFDRLGGSAKQAQAQGPAGQGMQQSAANANAELRAVANREPGSKGYVEIPPTQLVQQLGMQNRIAELRTLSTSTTGAGGNLAPTDFYDTLIAHLIEVSGIMQAGPTVLNTAGGETLQIPKTTSHSLAASASQAGAIGTSDPAFGLITLSAYKYGILLQVSRELIDDSGVDLLVLPGDAGRPRDRQQVRLGPGDRRRVDAAERADEPGDHRRHRHHHREVRGAAVLRPGEHGVLRDRAVPPVPVVLLADGGQDGRRDPAAH